jgi:hypothetical protein
MRVFWVSLVSLLVWMVFIAVMITQASAKGVEGEVLWTRLAWLFSSVEAVAFGAAGALFGANVQRERAENAERRAEKSEETASNGRALAAALIAEESSMPAAGDSVESYGPGLDTHAADVASRHAALARLMFPSLSTVADISSGRTAAPDG